MILQLELAIKSFNHYGTLSSRCYLCPVICVCRYRFCSVRGIYIPFCVFVRLGQHQKMRQMVHGIDERIEKRVYTQVFLFPLLNKRANTCYRGNFYVKIDTCYVLCRE